MRELNDKEVRKIQIEVMQEFHNFCTSHHLKYSLCAGTLLGAIRHHGYIPWDDDIDVMMPRRDYQILLDIYNSDNYTLYHYAKQQSYMISYAKLCDNRTIVKENTVYKCDYGIDIDIFPLDFFPDTIEESEKWSKHLGILKDMRDVKNISFSHERSLSRNILLGILRLLLLPIPMKWLVRKVDFLSQKYSSKSQGFLGNMTNGYRMKERNPMASSLIDVEFEGLYFKAIENYDIYLRGLFGDYMMLPPEEKRVSHHSFKAYLR